MATPALYADLEAGASAIAEFQPFIPGLLQTPEFAHQWQVAEAKIGPVTFQSERAVEARQTRQRMLRRADRPSYEVVLDEIALRRLSAPPQVMAAQVEHLVACAREPKITVRVLPVAAAVDGYVTPRSAFSLYTYPDRQDPRVIAVDTLTTDVVLTSLNENTQVTRYTNLYERLRRAAQRGFPGGRRTRQHAGERHEDHPFRPVMIDCARTSERESRGVPSD